MRIRVVIVFAFIRINLNIANWIYIYAHFDGVTETTSFLQNVPIRITVTCDAVPRCIHNYFC